MNIEIYEIEDEEEENPVKIFNSFEELRAWDELCFQELVLDLERMILMTVGSTGMADVYILKLC